MSVWTGKKDVSLTGARKAAPAFLLLALCFFLGGLGSAASVQAETEQQFIFGSVLDEHQQPIKDVLIELQSGEGTAGLSSATSQADGSYALLVPAVIPDQVVIQFNRPHFKSTEITITDADMRSLRGGNSIALAPLNLEREITAAFWIAGIIFIVVLVLIATGYLHNTLAALAGASMLLAISYLGSIITPDLFVFNFQLAVSYIDWNVIFLVMGMMMIIAVVENTGIFHWLAYFAYRISKGKILILLSVLMLFTGIASAFLDNVTTMLLMTPISVQIALALNISPLVLLIPEVFASNVIGVSTLIGTPTNILIGSFGKISFNDFLHNLTPGVFLAFLGLIIYSLYTYRKELGEATTGSEILLQKLEERGKITNPDHLKKAGWVGLGMLFLFVFGENVHLLPSVTALIGASILLIWIRPDVEEMIGAVDWTTLVFFMALFIVVGAIQEVGIVSLIAGLIGNLIGSNLVLAMILVTWISSLLSMVIANIPFTAAMLPVISYLTLIVPGAESKVLFYCLSIGAAFGGNGSLIGASANMITAGIADRAGYRISYKYFLQKGFPALIITVSISLLWLFYRFQ